MKINSAILTCVLSLISVFGVFADSRIVTDPVADYIQRHKDDLRPQENKNEHVLKFEIDMDNDGKVDVFLCSEKSALLSNEYDNAVRAWDLYKNQGEGNYAAIDQQKTIDGSETYFTFSHFVFDPQKIYVGLINEIGAYGMLVMYYIPRKNGAYISAYIVGNDYFESKNFPDPAASEVEMYHRDNDGNNPDLPDKYKHYFATPPSQTVTVLSQTF